jgi:hypothetical protein
LHIDYKSASLSDKYYISVRHVLTIADNSLHRTSMSITIYSWGECVEHTIYPEKPYDWINRRPLGIVINASVAASTPGDGHVANLAPVFNPTG